MLTQADSVFSGLPEKVDLHYDKKRLEQGGLQTYTQRYKLDKGGEGKRVIGIILIDAPPETVWRVLEDWEGIGNVIPSLEYYRTRHIASPAGDSGKGMSYIEGKLKVGFLSILYTVCVTFDKTGLRQDWKLVDETEADALRQRGICLEPPAPLLKDIRGFEYIEPYGDGSRTIYYYAPVIEVSVPIPAWIERRLSESCLDEYMEGVKKKAEGNN